MPNCNGFLFLMSEIKKREGRRFQGGFGNAELFQLANSEWRCKSRAEKFAYKERAKLEKRRENEQSYLKKQMGEKCVDQRKFLRNKKQKKNVYSDDDDDDELLEDFYGDYPPRNNLDLVSKIGETERDDLSDDDNSKFVPNQLLPNSISNPSTSETTETDNNVQNISNKFTNLNVNSQMSPAFQYETFSGITSSQPQDGNNQSGQYVRNEIVRPATKSMCARVLEYKRNSQH